MNRDNIVIIVHLGGAMNDYSNNANIIATVVDLDEKKVGENYINTFEWPDTQFDEEAIQEAIGDKVKDFMN